MNKTVIISVLGGVAEIEKFDDGVEVIIKDYDNCPKNGLTE